MCVRGSSIRKRRAWTCCAGRGWGPAVQVNRMVMGRMVMASMGIRHTRTTDMGIPMLRGDGAIRTTRGATRSAWDSGLATTADGAIAEGLGTAVAGDTAAGGRQLMR